MFHHHHADIDHDHDADVHDGDDHDDADDGHGHGGHSQDDADAVGGVPVRSRAELGGNSDDTSSASPLSHSRMIQIRSS